MSLVCRMDAVSKRYGREIALDQVTVNIESGQILGIIGPNGAGKTTMLRILVGLLRPSSGAVVRGAEFTVRYFGGEQTLPPFVSARRWVRLCSNAADRTVADVPRRRMGLLSRGTRQKIGLTAAMRGETPSLLVLDEPWEGLDPDGSRWLSQQLLAMRAAGTAVLVSSHRIHELADVCDRCEFLIQGRLSSPVLDGWREAIGDDRVGRLFEAFDRARGGGP
jgi:ABC-2 type transport system ATP-binding protein